jgi:hypothetical protein
MAAVELEFERAVSTFHRRRRCYTAFLDFASLSGVSSSDSREKA